MDATKYRVVITYDSPGNHWTVAGETADKADALRRWKLLVDSGTFTPDAGKRARVMSTEECSRVGIR